MARTTPLRQFPVKDPLKRPQLSRTTSDNEGSSVRLSISEEAAGNGLATTPVENGKRVHDVVSSTEATMDKWDSSDACDIEDYDHLELNQDTLVANSRRSMEASYRRSGTSTDASNKSRAETISEHASSRKFEKRNSIQIRLEKTDRKGRYILSADDPEIRKILRKGIERQEAETGAKKKQQPRMRFRDLVFTRQFTTFDRQNPSTSESPFFGFFTLFWIAMVLLFFQFCMHNYRDYGSILGTNQILKMMFSHDVLVFGLTDGVMCAATAEAYFFQKLIQKGWIRWTREGWILQNLWQSAYLGALIGWTYFRKWPWTHAIFTVLHGLVFLMKQHSYAFYNGYLSCLYRRRVQLERKLKQLEHTEPIASPPVSPLLFKTNDDLSSGVALGRASSSDGDSQIKRRPPMRPRLATDLTREELDVASVARAIRAGSAIDADQMRTFEDVIKAEIEDLNRELKGKNTDGKNAYPNNLTKSNFFDFICLPTLVYELEYPRQERINWWYVLEKTTATFGVLCVMMVISQAFIYPPVAKTVAMKEAGMPIEQRWQEFPFIVSDMLFPLLIEQLLTWYLIWECILNVLAEVTKFADRGFYGDWWNSVTWDQYARDWNRPVHNFLLRHVYHSSISSFHLSRNEATFVTFLLSALVHELCMAIMFKKVRGYLFLSQLLQLPLVTLSRSKMMKGRVILGNVIFWFGLFIGPSFLTSLYLVI